MGMRTINLYVDDADIELAKFKGINLSQAFRVFLSIHLQNPVLNSDIALKEQVEILKVQVAQLVSALATKTAEHSKTLKENQDLKQKLFDTKGRRGRVIDLTHTITKF